MKTVSIIQARMGSTRLPGKISKLILGKPMLTQMLERVKKAKKIDEIIVATTNKSEDDLTAKIAEESGVKVFRGSELDVLDRFYCAAKNFDADIVVRLTGDCPLMDPQVIDGVITRFQKLQNIIDYSSTPHNYPEGLDVEIFSFSALKLAAHEAGLPSEREHVSLFIKNHPERFGIDVWKEGHRDDSKMHWSVDSQSDFDFVTKVYEKLYPINSNFDKDEIIQLLSENPSFLKINEGGTGYEGLAKSLKEDEEFKKNKK